MASLFNVIISDLGGVLVNFTHLHESEKFLKKCGVSHADVKNFFSSDDFHDYERGKGKYGGEGADKEFFSTARKILLYDGDYYDFERTFSEALESGLNRDVFDFFFRELKGGRGLNLEFWLLSNLNPIHYRYISKNWPGVFSNCRRVFLSFKLHCRKPEADIFRAVRESSGVPPCLCCLVDDLESNCAGAREAGFGAVHFTGIEELRSTFGTLGIRA